MAGPSRQPDLSVFADERPREAQMMHSKSWTVEIFIDENEDERQTYAQARLHTADRTDLRGE
jgi:hypothetical protein